MAEKAAKDPKILQVYFDGGPLPTERCDGCEKQIIIWPENELAWYLFLRCQNQIIPGESGYIVGPRHDILWRWIDAYEEDGLLDDSPLETIEKVLLVFDKTHDLHNKDVSERIRKAREKKPPKGKR